MGLVGVCWWFFLALTQFASATHFAYGTINWVFIGRNAQGLAQVKIVHNYAFRRNFARVNWGYPDYPTYTTNCTQMLDPFIGACPIFQLSIGLNWITYSRDAPTTFTQVDSNVINPFLVMQESLNYLALDRSSDVNWIRGKFILTWNVPSDVVEYVTVFTGGDRLSTLLDGNNDNKWLVASNIKIQDTTALGLPFLRTRGPSTTGSIREYLEHCVESGFTVPKVKGDGQNLLTYFSSNTSCGATVPMASDPAAGYLPKTCMTSKCPNPRCATAGTPYVTLSTAGKLTWYPRLPDQALCSSATTQADCTVKVNTNKRGCFWDQFRNFCEKKDEYSVQFTLKEQSTAMFVTYDVIFEVSKQCVQNDTTCNHAPHFSPRFTGPTVGTPNTPPDASYHKSICGNATGVACECLRGVERILPINAVDYDLNQTVTASWTELPFGGNILGPVLTTNTPDPYDSNIPKSWTAYELHWIPAIDATDTIVCFQALDSQGKASNGNYCVNYVILEAEFIYVSGVIRDFFSNHSDFARVESTADHGVQWVNSTLQDGKPVRNGVPAPTAARFNDWFNDVPGVNTKTVFSTTLIRLGTEDRFTYSNTNFLPINGLLFGNDDKQGYPTRAGINTWFTYEMHSYLIFNQTTNVPYTYGSSDDMWLFINGILVPGWQLHGIHPAQSQSVDLTQLYTNGNPLQFVTDVSLYRVDVFYAQRSKNRTQPFIKMELPKAVLCDALSSGIIQMQFNFSRVPPVTLVDTGLYRAGSNAIQVNGLGLLLLNSSQSSSAVYAADDTNVPMPLKILQGFQTTFSFNITPGGVTQGLAFVMSTQNSVGQGGPQLGYGGIPNQLVVEFDTSADAANGDPAYDQVCVMAPTLNISTGFSGQPMYASAAYALGCSRYDPAYPEFGPYLTMDNGTKHSVRITYAPPQAGDTSATKTGWLRVWMGQIIKPVVEVPIPTVFLAQMFGSSAFVGFTTGAGPEATGKVWISDWEIKIVPPSPTTTGVITWNPTVTAGQDNTVVIQSRDSCGNNILVGADQDRYTATIEVGSSSRILTTGFATSFTTNNDGTYNFKFSVNTAQAYRVRIRFDGVEIMNSPYGLAVGPAQTSAPATNFVVGTLPVLPSNAPTTSPSLYMIAVRRSDGALLGQIQDTDQTNLQTFLTNYATGNIIAAATVGLFQPTLPSSLTTAFNNLKCSNFSLLATQSASWTCVSNGTVGNQMFMPNEPILDLSTNYGQFVVSAQSSISPARGYLNILRTANSALTFLASLTDSTVSVIARDQFGNINTNSIDTFSFTFSPPLSSSSLLNVAPGYFAGTFHSTVASTYTMSIVLVAGAGGGNIAQVPAPMTVLAGIASALTSTASGIGLSSSQAGLQTNFSVQLIDAFGNQIRDTPGALSTQLSMWFQGTSSNITTILTWMPLAFEYTVTYTPTILGTYNVNLMINGASSSFVQGRTMLVSPGAVFGPACTYSDVSDTLARLSGNSTPISGVAAGVRTCIYVQSRDQFGNARNDPSDIFSFKLTGSVRDVLNSSYTGGGLYVSCFVPVLAPGFLSVSMKVGGLFVGSPALNKTVAVVVGSPSALSTMSVGPMIVTAGQGSPVNLNCIDSEGNNVTSCNPSFFSFTLVHAVTGVPLSLNAVTGPGSTVIINVLANITANYNLQVKVGANPVVNSPRSVTVVPGATDNRLDGRSTPPSGAGAFGGVQSKNTSFFIQCADIFGNLQVGHSDTVKFQINGGPQISAQPTPSPGLWQANYTVPGVSPFYISYIINGVLSYNRTAFAAADTDLCSLGWNYTGAPFIVPAGTAFNLFVPYYYGSVLVKNNTLEFTNNTVVNHTIFLISMDNPAITAQPITFDTAVDATQTMPFQGSFSGLQTVGVYTLTAYAQQVVGCTPTTNVTVVAGPIFPPATLYNNVPLICVAGQTYNFQVALRDRFAQVISDPLNFVGLWIVDVQGIRPTLAFGSSYDGASSNYTFTFSVSVAGTYHGNVNLTAPQNYALGVPPVFTVVPGDPSPVESNFSASIQQTAGTLVELAVTLYDSQRNLVTNFNASQWTLNLTIGGAIPQVSFTPNPDGHIYVSYKPIVAGLNKPLSITLLKDGAPAGLIRTLLVNVSAADVQVPPSDLVPALTAVAGTNATLIFNAKDMYNNSVFGASLTATAVGPGGVKFPTVREGPPGQYQITLLDIDTQRAGSYVWSLLVNSQQVTGFGTITTMVTPGNVDWQQTLIPGQVGLSVGVQTNITIQLKDQFGNPVNQSSAAGIALKLTQPAYICSFVPSDGGTITVIDTTNTSVQNAQITALPGGQVNVAYTPVTQGSFRILLQQGGIDVPCQDTALIGVSAGPVYPPASLLTITQNTTADPTSVKTARIEFFDQFGNHVDDTTRKFLGRIYFGNASYGAVQPQPNWIKPTFTVRCEFENGFFVYYVTFDAPTAGTYVSVLVLKDENNVYDVISGQRPLYVLPGLAASFSSPTNPQGVVQDPPNTVLKATYPGQFRLTAKDAENNIPVQTDHWYDAVCRLMDNGQVLYSFVPTWLVGSTYHTAYFFPTWNGTFQCEAKLYRTPSTFVMQISFLLTVQPVVCPQFACPDGSCVSAYSSCVPSLSLCPTTAPVRCWDLSCAATSLSCPCKTGTEVRCQGGYCVAAADDCPPAPLPGSCATTRCPTGECPSAQAPCPSLVVCPPPYIICPDSITCALDFNGCPAAPSCPGNQFACAQGTCVDRSGGSCPTRATCPGSTVLCFDGTCAASSLQCPSIYPCPTDLPYRCPDGSCTPGVASCPSQTTCPPKYVLCWNDVCAADISRCDPPSQCPAGTLRCSTGSCALNMYLCPTALSCPSSASVLCADGSCVESAASCDATFVGCPTGSLTCPDGSCLSNTLSLSTCPTETRCAAATPVACTDGRCVVSSDDCTTPSLCPVSAPVRCSDGSCVGSRMNCPTRVSCPAVRPVLCDDGYCTADANLCTNSSTLACPAPLEQCFYGECVPYAEACPVHTTCPAGYVRCEDGTCRTSCATVIPLGECPTDQVQCPQSSIGRACAPSLSLCPPGIVCPTATPVRCYDGSCRDSLVSCPQNPTYGTGGAIPCVDGSWSPDGTCGTPVYCPLGQFLCPDYQCVSLQSDCKGVLPCAQRSDGSVTKVLQCGTVCVADFSANECTRTSSVCAQNIPYLCPDGSCVASPDLCQSSAVATSGRCAPLTLCRDGSCQETCPSGNAVCQAHSSATPYMCQDGMCAASASQCNKINGCPPSTPLRCPNSGLCTAQLKTCVEIVCPQDYWQSFGFCVRTDQQGSLLSNGCPVDSGYRCFDGSCVNDFAKCTSPTWDLTVPDPPNLCPFTASFRCSSGFCAESSSMCPSIPLDYCAGSTTGQVACASGTCVTSTSFCPTVRPCEPTEERGSDGVCRSIKDFIQFYGDLVTETCRDTYPFRCSNGLCAKDAASCLNPVTMCPQTEPVRCPNGNCISLADSVDSTKDCDARELPPSGCTPQAPTKCWNGQCEDFQRDCPTRDMCPIANNSRCPQSRMCVSDPSTGCGSDQPVVSCSPPSFSCDSCETDVDKCVTSQGCPMTAPVRCANGNCTSAGTCTPTVICDRGLQLCADGSCQFALAACPPFPPCSAGDTRCSDNSCRKKCNRQVCPSTSPLLCLNGACTNNFKLCPGVVTQNLDPAVPNGNDTYTGVDAGCTKAAPRKCWDGRCRATFDACITFAEQVDKSKPGALLLSCADPHIICPDGSCAKDLGPPTRVGVYCTIIPRCPVNQYRCGDGSCQDTFVPHPIPCGPGTERCEDGRCRPVCLAYDGCPLKIPFHCPNGNCASGPGGCDNQPNTEGVPPARRLLQNNATTTPMPCYSNCLRHIKAYQMKVTVNSAFSTQVDLALDSTNNVVASIIIPSGSILPNSDDSTVVEIRPVADSLMRSAENAVHPTRQQEFGDHLPYPETLLSVAFECVIDESLVKSPFPLNLSYVATIDYTRQPLTQYAINAKDTRSSGPDVCLAYLYRIPALKYSRWTCHPEGVSDRHATPPNAQAPGVQLDHVQGVFADCGKSILGKIYGFIHSPLRATNVEVQVTERTWAEQNVLLVLMIFLLAAIMLLLCIYCGFRLQRYRKKYLKEAEAVDKLKEEVAEMEQFGGTAGTKDDEVEMVPNPLVVQLQTLQDNMTAKSKEEQEAELKQLEEDREIRKKTLADLKSNRDSLLAELQRLKEELDKQNSAPIARPMIDDFVPTETSDAGMASSSSSAAIDSTPLRAPAAVKTSFQSVRPKKAKDLDSGR